VVLFHCGAPLFTGGFVGVDIFFVISGYLITGVLVGEIRTGSFTISGFYERRARRILPALLFMLLVTIGAGLFILVPQELAQLGRSSAAAALFVSNNYFFLQRGYFTADAATTPLLHTWSLGVEEQFYILYPIFLLVLHRLRLNFLVGISVAAAASLALSAVTIWNSPTATFYLLPPRFWELLIGGVIALSPDCPTKVRGLVAATGLLACVSAMILFNASTLFPGPAAILPCAGAAAFIWASAATRVARVMGVSPLRFVGKISYSLYLWHWPILVFGRMLTGGDLGPATRVACVGATFLIAFASWLWVELPFRGKSRRGKSAVLVSGAFGIAVVSVTGLLINSGVPSRFSPRELATLKPAADLSYGGPGCFIFRSSHPTPASECLGPPNERGKVVAWGDSHALQFAEALSTATPMEFRLLGRAACAPLLGVVPARRGLPDETCANFNQDAIAAISADRSVRVVILAGRWVRFSFPVDDDDARSLIVVGPRGSSPAQGNLWSALEATIVRLQKAGKTVILFGQVPEFELSLPSCMARMHRMGFPTTKCKFNQETLPGSTFNLHLKQMASRIPGLLFVDVSGPLCDGKSCRRDVGGEPISFDRNHLTRDGAELVIDHPLVQRQLHLALAESGHRS
jgi:peptidoglycan/LPS O-acetylase OafA/YrhL